MSLIPYMRDSSSHFLANLLVCFVEPLSCPFSICIFSVFSFAAFKITLFLYEKNSVDLTLFVNNVMIHSFPQYALINFVVGFDS